MSRPNPVVYKMDTTSRPRAIYSWNTRPTPHSKTDVIIHYHRSTVDTPLCMIFSRGRLGREQKKYLAEFSIRSWGKLSANGVRGNCFNPMTHFYQKPAACTAPNGERLHAFLPRARTRQRCPFFPLAFKVIPEFPVCAVKQGKEGTQIGTEEVRFSSQMM